jgi:hypothetical protein
VHKRLFVAGVSIPALAIGFSALSSVAAQERRRDADIIERPPTGYEPTAIRVGGLTARPELNINEYYDSNIFATDDSIVGDESDFITQIRPSLSVDSDWSNHALGFFTYDDIARHADNDDEDWKDYRGGGRGRLDMLRSLNLTGVLQYRKLHEDRESPDDVRGIEPTDFNILPLMARSTTSRRV